MQDVTTIGFMRIFASFGAPDWFFTEFFRVHATSTLDENTLACITQNDTGRPVFAQIIGEDIAHMVRTTRELLRHSVAGIDLNLGCPAPKVFRKNVGGGLLRDLRHVDALLGELRNATPGLLSVKTRIGFDDADRASTLLDLVALTNKHAIDLLTIHGRTVRGLYRTPVDYTAIAHAVSLSQCPVLANGDISSATKAAHVLASTGCAGVMLGRHAVRNPWVFRQIREHLAGKPVFQPHLSDVREYIDRLVNITASPSLPTQLHASRMKKFLNFIGTGVDPEGAFLKVVRRASTLAELLLLCDIHLIHGTRAAHPFPAEAYPGITARPNCE
jgi:tRNA-dihydrouridine synthase